MTLLRTTISTLTGLAFSRLTNLFGPGAGAFDLAAFDDDAFDSFDGGAIGEDQQTSMTRSGLSFSRGTDVS